MAEEEAELTGTVNQTMEGNENAINYGDGSSRPNTEGGVRSSVWSTRAYLWGTLLSFVWEDSVALCWNRREVHMVRRHGHCRP